MKYEFPQKIQTLTVHLATSKPFRVGGKVFYVMEYFVYILYSAPFDKYYVGQTSNVKFLSTDRH